MFAAIHKECLDVFVKNSDALKFLHSNDQHISENTEVTALEYDEACVTLMNES